MVEPGESAIEHSSFGDRECAEQPILRGVNVSLCGGVQSRARPGEGNGVGAAVVRVGFAKDEAPQLKLIQERDQPRLVITDGLRQSELRGRRLAGKLGEHDVLPHRQSVAVENWPLGGDKSSRDPSKLRSEVLTGHEDKVDVAESSEHAYDLQMPTTALQQSQTRAIAIAAPPDIVLDLVADAVNLPLWAPKFAPAVRAEKHLWIISRDGEEVHIRVRVDREHGTVDLLAASQPTRGAFTRVVPNGHGSEYLFTLFFRDGTDEATVGDQMAIVDEELKAVRELCERAAAPPVDPPLVHGGDSRHYVGMLRHDASVASTSKHISQVIDRTASDVYDYVSNPANLPEWARGLAGSVQQVDGQWTADSPMGRVVFAFVASNDYGVLDHEVTLPSGQTVYNPMRVIADGGSSEVVFTMRRQPDTSEEAFARDADAVSADLSALKRVLEEQRR